LDYSNFCKCKCAVASAKPELLELRWVYFYFFCSET